MVPTPLKRKGQLADDSFGIPRARPQGTGIRTRWRKLSTGARSMLCIHAASSAYEDYYDWPSDSKDFLHTRSRSDLSWPTVSQDGGVSSSSSSSPLHSTPRRAQRTHAEKAGGKNGAKEATKTPTAIRAPEQTSHSEAAASLNALLIKEKGAHRRGDASPFCDRASSVFRFDGTTSTSTTTTEHHHQVESGDTIRALIDTMFQIGDRSCAPSPGPPPMPFTDDAVSEKTAKTRKEDEDEGRTSGNGVAGRQKKAISAGRRWEAKEDADAAADARRAWEALKRRVMYIEEHGALPDDFEEEDAAASASAPADHRYRGAEAEEGALRDRRACSRKCWAQEVLVRWQAGQQQQQQHPHPHLPHPPLQQQLGHGQARDEKKGAGPKEEKDSEEAAATTTATTATRREKGRRHGGCWIRKKDGVFVRLCARRP